MQQAADHVPAADTDALRQRLAAPGLHVEQGGCQVVGLGWVLCVVSGSWEQHEQQ